MEKLRYVLNICIVFLMILTIAITRDQKILGRSVKEVVQYEDLSSVPIRTILNNDKVIIHSTELAKDIIGFGGMTPIKVHFNDDIVERIDILTNNETSQFLDAFVESGIIDQWIGLTSEQILSQEIDAVSGSTITHQAVVGNMMRVAAYMQDKRVTTASLDFISLKNIMGVFVILFGIFLTFTKAKNRRLKTLLQILNISILGFWCGSFLSLSTLITWTANGFNITKMVIPTLLFCVAILGPLLGKKGNYCAYHCPMGASQDLCAKGTKRKYKISQNILNRLDYLRELLLMLLLFSMWLGFGFSLIEYEVFTIFIPQNASLFVICLGVIFLLLSTVINRPYCRFVCPTGALLKISQM